MTVALINMPFAPATRPSMQLGILRALLDEAAVEASEFYASIAFFDRLRAAGYLSQYTAESPSMVSEWYFAERPFDARPFGRDFEAVARLNLFARASGFRFSSMLDIRERVVPAFLEELASEIAARAPRVACFTLSYAQLNASFALARRLKALLPDVVTVFGGAGSQVFEAACREYMGAFPAVDVMVLGEAESAFAPLVRRLLDGASVDDLPGIMHRAHNGIRRSGGHEDPLPLDTAATPCFEAYFETRNRMPIETKRRLEQVIPMELGRGCTWGDERTCKFCAFTFHGKYRGKSRERVVAEAAAQAARYRVKSFYFLDDIVTNSQITDVLPAMAQAVPRMSVQFMEMRTATTRRHVQALAESGVMLVQPGTENFDDGLLKRISKGTTTFHNVQFLKWAREQGVRVSHNVLTQVPQSERTEVESQLDTIRRLTHLDPPYSFPVQLVRFSPYHEDPDAHGLGRLVADPFYRYLYPDGVDIENVAYEFVRPEWQDALADLHRDTGTAVLLWQQRWGQLPLPYLVHEPIPGGGMHVIDGRRPGRPDVHRFDATTAAVHALITDCPMNEEGIVRALRPTHPDLDEARVATILGELTERGVALKLRGRWLSLALSAERMRRYQAIPRADALQEATA